MSRQVRRRLELVSRRTGRLPDVQPGARAGGHTPAGHASRRRAEAIGDPVRWFEQHPRLAVIAVAVAAGSLAGAAGGPVAAAMIGVYLAFATAAWIGHRRSRLGSRRRTEVLDAIGTLAADLRAGLSPAAALSAALPVLGEEPSGDEPSGDTTRGHDTGRPNAVGFGTGRVDTGRFSTGRFSTGRFGTGRFSTGRFGAGGRESAGDRLVGRAVSRLAAAWQVSERLGAPLADLLDRVESDLRAAERVRLTAAAQTAGARATTWLLAGLPLAGVALGLSMGVDALGALLHTRLGAGCALGALAFQSAGIGWSAWLTRLAMDEVDQ